MKFTILAFSVFVFLCCFISFVFGDDFETDFSEGEVGLDPGGVDWLVVDEPAADLGDKGPSSWSIMNSPIDGRAMSQSSNIWGDATDAVAIGSFVIYDKAEWSDFILDLDVVANDNDGMGLVWRWEDRLNHYRYITMIDPGNSPNGRRGPYRLIERRLGKDGGAELPFYETLAESNDSYTQGVPQHWTLEAFGNEFRFYVDDKLTLEAKDSTYEKGKVGFLVYAQSGVFFDNLEITDTASVDSQGKLATTWARMKKDN